MRGNLSELMKQAQKMQADLQKAQEEIAEVEVTGQAGGGMVSVVMNGRHEVRSVKVDPSLLDEDRDMLEDLVAAAVNDAVQRVNDTVREKMGSMTAGMQMPPGMNLF